MNRRDFLRTAGGVAGGGAAVAAGSGTAAAQTVQPVWPDYVSDASNGSYEDLRGQSEVTVTVGPGGNFSYGPTKIWIDSGTTVTFEWASDFHNVVPQSQPEGAGWEGSPGGSSDTYDEGYTFESTFETGGMYSYYCQPHESSGMKGAIAVGDSVETEQVGGGGGGEVDPEHMGVPFRPHYVGVATVVMMVVSLVFTFFVLKYGESPNATGGNN